jgi:hypothetical protein
MTVSLHTTGTDSTYNTSTYREDALLQKYLEDNWPTTLFDPLKNEIAFGYTLQQMGSGIRGPDGTGLTITLFCYSIPGVGTTNLRGIGWAYEFNTRVRIDVGVRDERAASGTGIDANRSPKVTKIDKYLRNFITSNPTGMLAYGIQELKIFGSSEFMIDDSDANIYHYILPVNLHYIMSVY